MRDYSWTWTHVPWNILDTFDSMDGNWDCWKSLFLSNVERTKWRNIKIRGEKGDLSGATDIVEEFNRYFSSFMNTQSRQGGP